MHGMETIDSTVEGLLEPPPPPWCEIHQQACRSLDSLDSSILSVSKILDCIFIIL